MAVFVDKYEAKYPKAVDCLTKDTERPLTFFDFPGLVRRIRINAGRSQYPASHFT